MDISGQPIFLVGYMAAGKTTFGKALARALGRTFIDLDFYIVQRFHATVPELFASRGEEGFRTLEHNMLEEVCGVTDAVISCGGGTPCFHGNMELMNASGITVLLDASVDVLVRRVLLAKGKRPLLDGKSEEELHEFIATHLAQRAPYYNQAQLRFRSDYLENKRQIATSVDKFLKDNDIKVS